jgi:hypothetical protein
LAIVALAGDLQAWSGLLAFPTHEIRRWEPKKLRMHIYTVPATIREDSPASRRACEGHCPLGWHHRCRTEPAAGPEPG